MHACRWLCTPSGIFVVAHLCSGSTFLAHGCTAWPGVVSQRRGRIVDITGRPVSATNCVAKHNCAYQRLWACHACWCTQRQLWTWDCLEVGANPPALPCCCVTSFLASALYRYNNLCTISDSPSYCGHCGADVLCSY